jgi:hypothetical protein
MASFSFSNPSIMIHLINDLDLVKDDSIKIQKNTYDKTYEISYNDQNNGSPIRHTAIGLNRDTLMDYLYMVFKNQSIDEDGYKHIQISSPAMPRVLVSGSLMKEKYYREHMMEMLETSLEMLDNVNVMKKSLPTHEFYD